ncbi:MAG: hypothetical protein WBL44_06520 [Nitrososphaeraceae archaeon]
MQKIETEGNGENKTATLSKTGGEQGKKAKERKDRLNEGEGEVCPTCGFR